MASQDELLNGLIERAQSKGYRLATEWEILNADPRDVGRFKCGGPVFFKDHNLESVAPAQVSEDIP